MFLHCTGFAQTACFNESSPKATKPLAKAVKSLDFPKLSGGIDTANDCVDWD
jgi:hypothetical protein